MQTYHSIKETEMLEIFSFNLRHLRKSPTHKLSQKVLARILHVPLCSYTSYEHGKRLPPVYVVYRIACYYDYTMEELLTQKIYKKKGQI